MDRVGVDLGCHSLVGGSELASELDLSRKTVETHFGSKYRKVRLHARHTRSQLVRLTVDGG